MATRDERSDAAALMRIVVNSSQVSASPSARALWSAAGSGRFPPRCQRTAARHATARRTARHELTRYNTASASSSTCAGSAEAGKAITSSAPASSKAATYWRTVSASMAALSTMLCA
jgi:hypothetical protein